MKVIFLLFSIFLFFANSQLVEESVVLKNCFTVPIIGDLCIKFTNRDCFQLTGIVSLGDREITRNDFPIGTILQNYQNQADVQQPTVCREITQPNFQCSICSTAKELSLNGGDLHYCGSMTLNCSTLLNTQPFVQTVNPDCVNIRNCEIYGCKNNCHNAGTCTAIGMCKCDPNYYGFDCSMQIKDGCIQSNQFPKTCWKAKLNKCTTIDFEVSTLSEPVVQETVAIDGGTLSLLPCQNLADSPNCQICATAEKLYAEKDQLKGCPSVSLTCDSVPTNKYSLSCDSTILIIPELLTCDGTAGPANKTKGNDGLQGSSEFSGKTILFVLVGILALLAMGALAYFAYTKVDFFGPYKNPAYATEDEAPLSPGQIEDDLEDSGI